MQIILQQFWLQITKYITGMAAGSGYVLHIILEIFTLKNPVYERIVSMS